MGEGEAGKWGAGAVAGAERAAGFPGTSLCWLLPRDQELWLETLPSLSSGHRKQGGRWEGSLLIGQEDSFSWQKGKIPEYDSHHISSLP